MATELLKQELMQGDNLRKQLAVAVRSIQWSYAIFWSISTEQQGVLEWKDGYYNGDIKTRKTMQPMELSVDMLGLKRSEQLKELYECLTVSGANEQVKRPSASLSPDDLSDAEWYYLVCMSFTFAPGVGLPGRAFANGQNIWLCNAQYEDSKVFTRSLLAKSASIETVVCIALLGGVIEFGVSDKVMEDFNLLQHIKAVFLDFPNYISCEKPILRPRDVANGVDSFMAQGVNDGDSQVQSWQFMEDDLSNCVPISLNSSDCISQTYFDPKKRSRPKERNVNIGSLLDLQHCNSSKCGSFGVGIDDVHYTRTLSVILGNNNDLFTATCSRNGINKSSFVRWKKGSLVIPQKRLRDTSQKMLKKMLLDVPSMYADCPIKSKKEKERNPTAVIQFLSEETRNDTFHVLRTLAPSTSKVEKASLLVDTIRYLKYLEKRIEDLESKETRKCPYTGDRKSDNNSGNDISNHEKPPVNKRKASDVPTTHPELEWVSPTDSFAEDVTV